MPILTRLKTLYTAWRKEQQGKDLDGFRWGIFSLFIVTGPLNEQQIGAVCTEMLKVNLELNRVNKKANSFN